jgi:hypothetical protein
MHSDSEEALQVHGAPSTTEVDPVGKADWSVEDETALIDFLIIHKAQAGDGLGYKPSVWTAAAAHMLPLTTKGGPKAPDKCKAKWGRVRAYYLIIYLLLTVVNFV